jgi:hypothetical protein
MDKIPKENNSDEQRKKLTLNIMHQRGWWREEDFLLICPVRMDERQQWQNVLWYGGDESSRWKERCLQARYHSNAQVSNGIEKECVESVVKSESYHEGEAKSPYIGAREDNCLRVLCRVIRERLEDPFRMILARRHAWMRCGALKFACSFRW